MYAPLWPFLNIVSNFAKITTPWAEGEIILKLSKSIEVITLHKRYECNIICLLNKQLKNENTIALAMLYLLTLKLNITW